MTVGPGFLLFLVFLVLKLTDVLDWSWWWVTAPLWVGVALYLLLILPFQLFVVGRVKKAHKAFDRGWDSRLP